MNFYIFRHGDTVLSKHPLNKFFGHQEDTHDLPILPDGRQALEGIGRFLKNVPTGANFCSPYLRCRESAKIAGRASNRKFRVDSRIGELEGKEKFPDFKRRVENFLTEMAGKKYPAVAICTHGAVIAAISHLATGKFYFFQVIDFPRPGILTIIKNGKARQKDFNTS